eukprot:jgi/Psemu1/51919/gm1.51919_g
MTQTAVSWNEVRGIHFSFGPNFTAGNRQGDLNAVFSQILPNISSLFLVDDDGVETLCPDPIPVLKSLIVAAIMDALPPSEPSGGRIRVRDKQVLDIAAKHAKRGHPIINLVLHIIHWQFHKDWYPYEFNKVYTTATGIPSDATGLCVKPPSQSRLVNIQKCEQILQTQYSQAVFGKDTTTKTLPPKRTYRCKHHRKSPITAPNSLASAPPTTSDLLPVQATDFILDTPAPSSNLINPSLNPVKPAEPNADTAVKVRLPYMTQSFDNTNLNNSNSADQPVDCQVADTPTANAPMPNKAPHYVWTWTYSPNIRSRSISFQRAASSSPPVQRQDESAVTPVQRWDTESTVTALPATPPTLPSSDHHPNETVTFHRSPKPATVPLEPPSRLPLSNATAADPVFSCPIQSKHNGCPTTFQTASRCLEDKDAPLVCEHLVNELLDPSYFTKFAIHSWIQFLQSPLRFVSSTPADTIRFCDIPIIECYKSTSQYVSTASFFPTICPTVYRYHFTTQDSVRHTSAYRQTPILRRNLCPTGAQCCPIGFPALFCLPTVATPAQIHPHCNQYDGTVDLPALLHGHFLPYQTALTAIRKSYFPNMGDYFTNPATNSFRSRSRSVYPSHDAQNLFPIAIRHYNLSITLVPGLVSDQQSLLFPFDFASLQLIVLQIDDLSSPLAFYGQPCVTSTAALDLTHIDSCLLRVSTQMALRILLQPVHQSFNYLSNDECFSDELVSPLPVPSALSPVRPSLSSPSPFGHSSSPPACESGGFFGNPQASMVDHSGWNAIAGMKFRFKGDNPFDDERSNPYLHFVIPSVIPSIRYQALFNRFSPSTFDLFFSTSLFTQKPSPICLRTIFTTCIIKLQFVL